ncbi:outer membrane protein [Consotaella salsifontis]|uniref:Outer membrane immunogenic protein n=1 Tax=Consotaella salsifontis TaxID=1365950 RepID=A0A1T4N3M0_9HYPH|nr:outer membrane protein [Consotaella salsifontis]SJZ73970.1 outer membrane immunogenic protein [Consotaella salsifontis]
MRSLRIASISLCALVISAGAAFAADAVVAEPPAPAPVLNEPVQVWSGPYAGVFVGYDFKNVDQSGSGASFDGDGFVGGVYTGYNWQKGSIVYGVEGDIGLSGVDAAGFNTATASEINSDDSNVFGSLRGRVGVAYDPFLVFATGGVAVAENELKIGNTSDSNTHVGYTVGGGVEAKISDNITSRLEYRYSDYGSEDYAIGGTTVSSGFDEHSIRAGVALKF